MRVFLAFKRAPPIGCYSSWRRCYNGLVSVAVGDFTHCELSFKENESETYNCFIVEMGKRACWRNRKAYPKGEWELYQIRMNEESVAKLKRLCEQDIRDGFKYDICVHFNLFVPSVCQCVSFERGWCSQHAVSRLQECKPGILKGVDPSSVSPQQLQTICSVERKSFLRLNKQAETV